jgi:hypothetical protein
MPDRGASVRVTCESSRTSRANPHRSGEFTLNFTRLDDQQLLDAIAVPSLAHR